MLLCSKALKRSSDTASAFAFLLQLLTVRRCQNVKEVKTRLRVQLPTSADKAPLLAVAAGHPPSCNRSISAARRRSAANLPQRRAAAE